MVRCCRSNSGRRVPLMRIPVILTPNHSASVMGVNSMLLVRKRESNPPNHI